MRVALVADWLPTFGGAEHVVAALHELWPDAPIFTTLANTKKLGPLSSVDIKTTRLQALYAVTPHHRFLLPLLPRAIEGIDLGSYDLILSSSHAVGKGIIPPPSAVHVCYCHTPMRYAWEMEDQYLKDFRIRGPLKQAVRKTLKGLRQWDLSTAKRVDQFIANSKETQERIARIYGRESIVIAPPVDDRFFACDVQSSSTHDYLLAVGRLVPYKRFDLLITLANKLGTHLKIAGTGHDEERLKAMAGPTVEFLGFVPDADLPMLYAGSRALLFPQLEDAGIVPLEAQASGTPVIAYGHGGVKDVVVDAKTGLLVAEQTVEAFADALQRNQSFAWDRSAIQEHARKFSHARFASAMKEAVTEAYARFGKRSVYLHQ